MVRLKWRWLIVRVENFSSSNNKEVDSDNSSFPTNTELVRTLREATIKNFGIASIAGDELSVRFSDPITGLVMVRVRRKYSKYVRSTITLMTTNPNVTQQQQQQSNNNVIVFSILSVRATARLAKSDTIQFIRKWYKVELTKNLQVVRDNSNKNETKTQRKDIETICCSMKDTLDVIATIDY